jgi:hypothetical protein
MSLIRDLKNNPENSFNLIDAISIFVPPGKSKYAELMLRLMKTTPDFKEQGEEIKEYFVSRHESVTMERLSSFNPIQMMMLYVFVKEYFNDEDLANLNKFCEYNERNLIDQNDLSKYKSFEDLVSQVNIAALKIEMKELENEVVRIHEDDEWLLVRPMTFLASKKYGSNTKWCTTSENNPEYFVKYAERGVLIYCMNKKTGYKVASFYSLKKSDPEFSFWNQKDAKIESMDSELSDSMLRIIRDVSKNPNAVSNRKLMTEEQLERENKSLSKWLKKAHIDEIVREYAPQPTTTATRLSNRIESALRRERILTEMSNDIEEDMLEIMEQPIPNRSYGVDSEIDGPDENVSESPTRPLPF